MHTTTITLTHELLLLGHDDVVLLSVSPFRQPRGSSSSSSLPQEPQMSCLGYIHTSSTLSQNLHGDFNLPTTHLSSFSEPHALYSYFFLIASHLSMCHPSLCENMHTVAYQNAMYANDANSFCCVCRDVTFKYER
jgi:hypothetical protein